MKKGVALLITLFFIIVIVGIITAVMNIYGNYIKDSFYKNISQNSVITENLKNVLKGFSDEINSSDDLDNIIGEFPVASKEGDFKADIEISRISDKLNINELGVKESKDYVLAFLNNILTAYEVSDPQYFTDLLLDTVDEDKIERNAESEIINYDYKFPNGKIYNFRQFKEIMDVYAKNRDDKNIYKIPWREYIYFGDKKLEQIDIENISDEMAKYLGLKFEGTFDPEEARKNKDNAKILQNLDIIPFDKKEDYFIKAAVTYGEQNITMTYNISTKKVVDIEYSFLY